MFDDYYVSEEAQSAKNLMESLDYWLQTGQVEAARCAAEAFVRPKFASWGDAQARYDEAMDAGCAA